MSNTLKEKKLQKNWTTSSSGYSKIIEEELNCFKRQAWTDLILSNSGKSEKMKILDVGTGPGFFAIIMAQAGHDVTAVDCTQAMLDEAKSNGDRYAVKADFILSDTQKLPFPDNSFDLVISRNVAWTIIDAESAYREWKRVLKSNGKVLIFDANWNIRLFNEDKRKEYERDIEEVKRLYPDYELHTHSDEMDDFRREMPMCSRIRPQWDVDALIRVGFKKICCNVDITKLIYKEYEQILNRSTPMFMISAEK